ncbi:NUDIX domain-containing protein [Nocardioides insulae]|uniref:NUDIX domain-containing protein n=1 Tax=Nocardioides insulae TaxID=394734 RepID=UPI00041A2FAD|nr:NUDIX hydrolase [Nocardioides insulae]
MSHPRVAAGALFFDDLGRVLLVKPTYKEGWEIPGGYVEPGETPIEACRREVQEELGLDRTVEDLLVVDWAPSDKEGDKILFVFDGGVLGPDDMTTVVLPPDELEAAEFHERTELPSLLIDRLARRILAALDARQAGRVAYLEHGRPVMTSEPR